MKGLSEKVVLSGFGFMLALAILGGAGIIFYFSVQKLIQDKQSIVHTYEVLGALSQGQNGLVNAESSRRGYILTGDSGYLETYEAGRKHVEAAIAHVRQLTQDNPSQQSLLNQLNPLVTKRLGLLEQSIKRFQQTPSDLTTQITLTNQGKVVRQELQMVWDALEDNEQTLLQQRTTASNTSIRYLILVIALGYALGSVLLVWAYLLLKTQIQIAKKLNEQLLKNEQLLRLFIQHTPAAVAMFDREMRYLLVSRQWLTSYNLDDQEILGKSYYEVFPDIPERWQVIHQRCLHGAIERCEEDLFQQADGATLWLTWEIHPWYAAANELGGVIMFTQNITGRKQAQQRLEVLNQELGRSNRELEQFAYIASHDLQEPLRAVIGYTQLLEREYPTHHLDESAYEYMDYIIDGAKRMQQLIQDLLSYSRISSHVQEFAPTDCNEVIQQVLRDLNVAIADHNAIITYDPLPTINADQTQLVRLFQNLISNAIKFHQPEIAPQAHVSAVRRAKEGGSQGVGEVEVIASPSVILNEWLFSVQDNGIGIKPQYFDRIFDIFKRLHTCREFPGTGMGLAICKKIVERHHGQIWVESEPGVGTTFYFTILS
jgi:PAS domain S-box-containing protein